MPSTNQLLPATLGSQVAKQAGKYKQGSPLLDRTAFQTSLQKHQVPICLIQKWECVLGSAILALFQLHNQTWSCAMTLDSKQNHAKPNCCFLPTSLIDSWAKLLITLNSLLHPQTTRCTDKTPCTLLSAGSATSCPLENSEQLWAAACYQIHMSLSL